jgi:hypothetical protein
MSIHSTRFARNISMLTLLVTGTLSGNARAEPAATRVDSGDYEYRFGDEDLLGGTLSNVGDMYKGRAKFHRVLLLRPRTAFVSHLFRSVENL